MSSELTAIQRSLLNEIAQEIHGVASFEKLPLEIQERLTKLLCKTRTYVYECPECHHTLPAVNNKGNEILNRICTRVLRHKSKLPVSMKLKKLEE